MLIEASVLRPELLIPLVAGHFLGDFVLQPDWMAGRKNAVGIVVLHAGIVAGVSWLLTGEPGSWWWLIPGLFVTHALVDLAKGAGERLVERRIEPVVGAEGAVPGVGPGLPARNGRVVLFTLDQAAHLLVLVGIVVIVDASSTLQATLSGGGVWLEAFGSGYLAFLVLAAGWAVAAPAVGGFLGLVLNRFEAALTEEQRTGLPRGGYWIGVTERSLIYLFILVGEPSAIGFLAAAKSVFRIGELREARDRNLAEYILIGTLMSFALAMAVGLLAKAALSLPATG